jgi:superfamily II DNA/RNA helicase
LEAFHARILTRLHVLDFRLIFPPVDIVRENAEPAEQQTDNDNKSASDPVRFASLNLEGTVQKGIDSLGFEFCSPIQGQILPHTLAGNDAIGKAQTGTGKTAAFLITIFNDLLCHPVDGERFLGEPRAIIIAPTRELVMQIAADADELGKFTGLKTVTLIGGAGLPKAARQGELIARRCDRSNPRTTDRLHGAT